MYIEDLKLLATHSDIAKKILENNLEICIDNDYTDFYPSNKFGCIELNDDYMFSIRCDNFIWIDGKSEKYGDSIFICGNHKGCLHGYIIYSK